MPRAPVDNRSWEFKLHSSHVIQLRNDPDFVTMIKVGRAMNALWFGLTTLVISDPRRNNTETRLNLRAFQVLGGYLHEAIEVVDRLKGRYLGLEAFEPLRKHGRQRRSPASAADDGERRRHFSVRLK